MRMQHYIRIALASLVFCGSLFYIHRGIQVGVGGGDKPGFMNDEAHKIASSYFFELFFERHDFKNPVWTEDFYARTNPPVGKYIFGAALAANGYRVNGLQLQEEFHRLWRITDELRKKVPDAMLRVTRGTSAVFSALVCLLLFLIGYRVGGLVSGLIGVILVLGNPFFVTYSRLGLPTLILLFHMILFIPICMLAARAFRRYCLGAYSGGSLKQLALLVLVSGVLPGFSIAIATGSKLNGALTGPIFAIAMVIAAGRRCEEKLLWKRIGLALLLVSFAAVVAFTLFVAINPYYYHRPISKAVRTLDIYRDWIIKQQLDPGGGLFGFWQRIATMGYYCLWSSAQPIARIFETLGVGWLGRWLASLCFIFGLGRLFNLCLVQPQRAPEQSDLDRPGLITNDEAVVITSWVTIITVFFALRWPLAWGRYLLLPYLAVCLTMAIGLASMPRAFRALRILFTSDSDAVGSFRALIGPLSAVTVSSILAFTPWLIEPALVPPNFYTGITLTDRPNLYTKAVDANPNSSILRWHLGLHYMRVGKIWDADKQFSTALEILTRDKDDYHTIAIQRFRLLGYLADVRIAMGKKKGAADALHEQIAMAELLRDGMISGDPKVLEEFNQLIGFLKGA